MATEVASELDVTQPIIRRKQLTAVNHASMMTEIDFGEYGDFATDEPVAHGGTGEGPSPLQTVLGALCGCESVTFNRTAAEMGFSYEKIEFEAEYTIDIRGRMGVRGVVPHFQTIRVEAIVTTSESEERLAEVVEETETRCPVFNLVSDAGVKTEMRWIRRLPQG
ncbi:MAG TPA: OsmC family protein [Acidimicrobiia bacterium]